VEVIGRAMNGREALRLVFDREPDLITLDLEMPEMDGFAFLRLLMNRRPTPVLVVSGYAQRENVFRALELGALDFVAKPSRDVSPDLKSIEGELLAKIGLVRRLQVVRLRDRAARLDATRRATDEFPVPRPASEGPRAATEGPAPKAVVAIVASTGGPPAIQQLLSTLRADLPAAILVAQHMPSRFTRAFADRLDRIVALKVVEAQDRDRLASGTVYVAPGSANLEIEVAADGPIVRVVAPSTGTSAIITPSGDHLFKSAAAAYGRRLCAVVLTGMGSDGRDGAIAAHKAGARVLVEDPQTAVMSGMPWSVLESGAADEVAPLEALAVRIARFVEEA
jgi:two-component system chemotaxis response regulator CheB